MLSSIKAYYSSLNPRHKMYMDIGLYLGVIVVVCLAWSFS